MRLIDADALTKECGDWYVEEGPEEGFIGTLEQLLSVQPETNCLEIPNNSDTISRQAALETIRIMQTYKLSAGDDLILINKAEVQTELMMLPPAQPDAITASLEELINDYGEDGYFIVDGVNYQANELLNELKINSSVGEKFRIQITKTIVAYFMKFGD